ncbi:hypothetical protein V8280_004025 [Escherichia coli]|uniref:Signal-peptide domain-containing protein n=1 Tax=Escherichia phage vB_EcoM_ACG-C40 TaxID=1141141 RepID=K4FC36_9CAUD|nr:hypothetical protein D862_gp057 [Escherichia phage vB_EcoM_ACG-C40]UEN68674.1 hypothetical protein [Escherichia phage MLP2]UIS74353.1 hypothetical protein [Escherichia phage EC101]URY14620.1 hypothetical protein [Shigella phage ESh30]WBF82896.1 hypothetical protein a48_56 [Escherichia phage a48]AFH20182.1 hypothetical protein ACG-C40_0217 [Escherichia phage vB_EcoM_ACG-C40]
MAWHHETWAIVIVNSSLVGTSNGQFCVFTSENRAWEECLKLREKNPDVELVVKKTKLPLPWKTYE